MQKKPTITLIINSRRGNRGRISKIILNKLAYRLYGEKEKIMIIDDVDMVTQEDLKKLWEFLYEHKGSLCVGKNTTFDKSSEYLYDQRKAPVNGVLISRDSKGKYFLDVEFQDKWKYLIKEASYNAKLVRDIVDILSLQEAAEIWGIDDSTLRHAIANGKFLENEEIRKTGRNWIITRAAMCRVYGEPKKYSPQER